MDRSPTRTRLLSAGLLLLVFGTGALVGIAWERAGDVEPVAAAEPDEERDRGDGDRRERRYMYEQVGLRDDQRTAIDSVVLHHREAMKALNAEFREDYEAMRQLQREYREAYNPRYWAIVDSTRAAIKAVLDPAQTARYDSLIAENDRRRERDGRDDDDGREGAGREGGNRD